MNIKLITKMQNGQSIVELLIVIGLAAIMLPTIFMAIIASSEGRVQERQRMKATPLIREAQDIVRNIRDNSWDTITGYTLDTAYHPNLDITGKEWILTQGDESINEFTRNIEFSSVFRDLNGAVAESGTLDPSTILVTTSISWTAKYPSTIVSKMYLTHHDNDADLQTTLAEFTANTLIQSQTTNTAGGECILGYNNRAKWCSPSFTKDALGNEITIDLPDGPPVAVSATASGTNSTPNDIFVATAPEITSSVKLAYLTVTANSDYPSPTLKGTFTLDPAKYSAPGLVPTGIDLDNNFKTNDVKYYKSPSGKTYALLATNLPDKEIIAIQINDGTSDSYQDPTNKIYKYWTYFNTKIYNSFFNSPSAHTAETSSAGDNNGYQTYPTRAYQNDGSSATDSNSGTNTTVDCANSGKDKHRFYNYDFSIPSGATINGIEANLVARADSTSGSPRICVQLSWDGGSTWTTAKTTNNLTTTLASYTLGGSADTWGRSWNDSNFSNTNFRVRVINITSNSSRDFYLDWVGLKVNYNGISLAGNDLAPYVYGAKSVAVLDDAGYVTSGGYLYSFDLSNIDTKTASNPLDQLGCRIELDGFDCRPGDSQDIKYSQGQTGSNWSTQTGAQPNCSDGGNIEIYANNDIHPVKVGTNKYIYVAVGAGTDEEFEIVNVTSTPDGISSPSITNTTCGRKSGGNNGWKVISDLDFNPNQYTQEAANSVYASLDGTRAYISSNGGIDGNNDDINDSHQFYILDTSTKTAPAFLSTWGSTVAGDHQVNTASSGYYNGNESNIQMHPRRSLTVLDGKRVVLVGTDAVSDGLNAYEYQVLNNETESTPNYCGGVDYNQGFNDLTSVSEADGDNYVYMVANTNEKQLKIIQGGPDTGLYFDAGTVESTSFDTGKLSAFNRFTADVTKNPPATDMQFQVAVGGGAGADCSSLAYVFIGPDGTETTKFASTSASIPLSGPAGYQNPGKCFRYKAYLSATDTSQTPILNDFIFNYSQ